MIDHDTWLPVTIILPSKKPDQIVNAIMKYWVTVYTTVDVKIPKEEISAIRSLVGQLNWLSGISRPDISFDTCNFSTKVNDMKIRDVIELNKVVKRVKNENNQILFPSLDPNTIQLVVYTDANFNNLPHSGSQGDYIIFLAELSQQMLSADVELQQSQKSSTFNLSSWNTGT